MTTKPSFTILFIRAVIDWSLFADNGLERVGLYSETKGGETGVANTLRNALMVRKENMLLLFWPTIGDGEFTIGSMVARMIQDPREKAEEEEKADDDGVGNLQRHIKHEQGDWQAAGECGMAA
ncbi:hypothetical protein Tco_1134009 [Tanacetum coccineum]